MKAWRQAKLHVRPTHRREVAAHGQSSRQAASRAQCVSILQPSPPNYPRNDDFLIRHVSKMKDT